MNEIEKLRNDARAVIAGYKAGDDFDVAASRRVAAFLLAKRKSLTACTR